MPLPAELDARIVREVRAGLPNSASRRDRAARNAAFYDHDGGRYKEFFRRDAESTWDQQGRPHRQSGFSREVIDVLTDHLYHPGPSRAWSVPAGDEWLAKVYADNRLDSLMATVDVLTHRAAVAAVQIDAGAGLPDRPITLRPWPAEAFDAWTDPDEPTRAVAVVTVDRLDLQTRYRLWTAESVRTFVTDRADGTAGGRVASLVADEPNSYGAIPFAFARFDPCGLDFWGSCPGDLLVDAEVRVDDRLSRLDESIAKHLNPVAWVKGMPRGWTPVIEPGRFLRLADAGPVPTPGGLLTGPGAEVGFLQAKIDVDGAWRDLLNFLNQTLEAVRAPLSAVRMEQQGVASGISLIVEQAPLLGRARKRRSVWAPFEEDLARLVLLCSGNHYRRPDLAAAAEAGRLALAWPQPSLAIPTPDRLEMLQGEVALGYKSQLQALAEWYGVDREQALAIVARIEADDAELRRLAPAYAAAVLAARPTEPTDPEPTAADDDPDAAGVEIEDA